MHRSVARTTRRVLQDRARARTRSPHEGRGDAHAATSDATAPTSFGALLETRAQDSAREQTDDAAQAHETSESGATGASDAKLSRTNDAKPAQETAEAAAEAESPAAETALAPRAAGAALRPPLLFGALALPGAPALAPAGTAMNLAPSATSTGVAAAPAEDVSPPPKSLAESRPTDEAAPDAQAQPASAMQPHAADARAFADTLESAAPKTTAREPVPTANAPKPGTPAGAAPAESDRASEILRQMRVHFAPEMRSATIQLTPVELGRISIRLHLEQGELRAVVRAEKRETLEALARHVPELRATLEQQGIQARQFDLQLGFQEPGARQQEPHSSADGNAAHPRDPQPAPRPEETRLARALAVHAGGVDTYA